MDQVLRRVLRPFLDNTDLLRAMFVGSLLSKDGDAATDTPTTDTTTTRRPTISTRKAGGGLRQGETRGGGEWSPPPSTATPANGKVTAKDAAPGQNGGSSEDDGPAADGGMWGYRSSLSSKGCWKVDAWASARKDTSVELGFDSVAFDLFVNPGDETGEKTAAAAVRIAEKRAAARHDHGTALKRSSSNSSGSSSSARAVVSNVVPFRLVDGLPRELGPILFSADEISSIVSAGDPDHQRPPSRGARRGHARQKAVAVEPEAAGSNPKENQEHVEEDDGEEEQKESLWARKKDPSGSGHVILSHVHRGAAADAEGTAVEVRIRGESSDVGGALARSGLPQDMSGLVVIDATLDAVPAGQSKRTVEVVARAGSGVNRQERRKQRAAAH